MLGNHRVAGLAAAVLFIAPWTRPAPASHPLSASAPSKSTLLSGDPPLAAAEVSRWFDHQLVGGDGKARAVTSGNDVTELVDGPAALKAISDEIRTTRGPYTVLYNFGTSAGDPQYPKGVGTTVEGPDGSLYTTSEQGGANNRGTVCKFSTDGKVTVLYNFDFTHGSGPLGGLTKASDGNFYGTTYGGGKYGVGAIFRITPAGQLSVLWDFRNGTIIPPLPYPKQPTEQQKLDAGGSYPISPPVQGADGNLYGITSYANNQQYGVIYRLSLNGAYTGLYMFKPADVAALGTFGSSVSAGKDGNLYATTLKGGLGWGTVLKISPGGGITCIHKFDAVNGQGAMTVMQASDKNLYGTAFGGGAGNVGLIYKITPAGAFSVIHAFVQSDGAVPAGGLVEAKDGWLYGTTKGGGSGGRGVLYKIRPSDNTFSVVHNMQLNLSEGRYCDTAPVQHSNGLFYGTTSQGGLHDCGVLYSVDLKRTDFVYALNWWMTDTFGLYGPNTPTVWSLFNEANNKGVQIRAMLWDQGIPTPLQNNDEVAHINAFFNGAAILDDRTLDFGSHHQKIVVVGGPNGLTAFCGGVDFNPDRVAQVSKGSPLHDVHCRIKGPAAGELLRIFDSRWNDHPDHKAIDSKKNPPPGLPAVNPAPITGATCWVQVGRTFGNGTKHSNKSMTPPYNFAPNGEQTAAGMIFWAIDKARSFIYLEDQYFVDTTDPASPGLLDVRTALVNKLKQPTFNNLTILITHGSISDLPQVNYRRQKLILALKAAGKLPGGGNKVHVFFRNPPLAAHSYVHAKTWIFDDEYAIIGSANTNRRSWTHDSEVCVGICDQGSPNASTYLLPHRLRMRLWAEHLNIGVVASGVPSGYEAQLADPLKSFQYWTNLPFGAHVAPYDENANIELIHTDTDWDTVVDPDGS